MFQGFLSAVFDVYERKMADVRICRPDDPSLDAFGSDFTSESSEAKAMRVWNGLKQRLSQQALSQVYRTFLSGLPGIDDTLLRYIRYVFGTVTSVECDFSNDAVRVVHETARKVYREKHRMEAFVRFQLTGDGLYYAVIEPDFDVLPLISSHFTTRYADQSWLIYDIRRKYGLYFVDGSVSTVSISFREGMDAGKAVSRVYSENEELYQQLWRTYFSSVNIAARKNTRLHIQHMPVRYWKHLTEKQPSR